MDVYAALDAIERFKGDNLTKTISRAEQRIAGLNSTEIAEVAHSLGLDDQFVEASQLIKRVSAQIDVVIHASGIITTLPKLLEPSERVISTSLGAGNTNRHFDLETDRRIAEFKFINWQGGSEAIRQNGLFKDFVNLAEYETDKMKELYVVETHHALKFLKGKRAIASVLKAFPALKQAIEEKYSGSMQSVSDYYSHHEKTVRIIDVNPMLLHSPPTPRAP